MTRYWIFALVFFACTHTAETNKAATPEPAPSVAKSRPAVETPAAAPRPVAPEPIPTVQSPQATSHPIKKAPKIASLPQKPQDTPVLPPQPTEAASSAPATITPAAIPSQAPSHAAWDALLQQAVGETGKVNYKTFKNNKVALEAYLKTLSDNPPQEQWSRAEKMAYWINAYNAFTIELVVDNYPLASILKLDGGKTWDVKRITLGGKKYSLNQIENDILRPQYKDARIHFALNCAAKSCPPLYNRAFTAENLETTLEARTKSFLRNPRYNTVETSKAVLSKIFEWYAADFGDLPNFINRYVQTPLKNGGIIEYREYDWDLNE